MLTAPGMRSSANSDGDLTSITMSKPDTPLTSDLSSKPMNTCIQSRDIAEKPRCRARCDST